MHARRAGMALALAVLGGCGGRSGATAAVGQATTPLRSPVDAPRDWRTVATSADRQRLREWRTAWIAALRVARGGGAAGAIDADVPLYAFDTALRDPTPPAGDYRCRTVKLGSKRAAGPSYVAYPFFRCRISARDGVTSLTKLTGSQRLIGTIFAHDATRAVFLGTLSLGDERSAMRYGRDASRDVAGWVERIAGTRWRVVQPYPSFESTLDLLELVPA